MKTSRLKNLFYPSKRLESPPNAARAKELVGKIKKEQVPTIFAELTLNPKFRCLLMSDGVITTEDKEL